eukprot:1160206-Pelagomonas_calceolata.AAC.3
MPSNWEQGLLNFWHRIAGLILKLALSWAASGSACQATWRLCLHTLHGGRREQMWRAMSELWPNKPFLSRCSAKGRTRPFLWNFKDAALRTTPAPALTRLSTAVRAMEIVCQAASQCTPITLRYLSRPCTNT